MPSLKLQDVLEEEYVSMYGPLTAADAAPPSAEESDSDPLNGVIRAIHKKERTALCISGGGIRSATFALGVIQGLARAGLLKRFDYLSTVSGGGYIGSWLSSWVRRDREGVVGVERALAEADTAAIDDPNVVLRDEDKAKRKAKAKLDPEPQPLRHLREYSNYLSPRLGLLSGDSWTLAAIYIRNLLLNLLVLVPLLAAALAIPRLFSFLLAQAHFMDPLFHPWMFAIFGSLGFAYLGQTRPVDYGLAAAKMPKFRNRDARFILFCVLPLTIAAIALAITWAREKREPYDLSSWSLWAAAAVAAVGMTILPWVLYYRRLKNAAVAARRAGFVHDADFKKFLWRKRFVELLAVIVALATMAVLFWLLADKVFDDPLRATPQLQELAPVERFYAESSPQAQLYVCFIVPLILLVFFVQASIFVGLSSKRNEDSDREWWARGGGWLLFGAALIAVLNVIAVFGPVVLYYAPVLLASVGGAAGVAAALLGFSDKTPANQKQKEEGGTTAKAGNLASALVVPLFVVFLFAAISFSSTWLIQKINDYQLSPSLKLRSSMQSTFTQTTPVDTPVKGESKDTLTAPLSSMPAIQAAAHLETIQNTTGTQLLVFLAVAVFGVLLSFCIGVNKFSMNALYRNRLVRAYLGASRYRRDPDAFTGFDEDDNIPMWSMRQELLWTTSIRDLDGLVDALKKDPVWNKIDQKTRGMFDTKPYDPRAKEMLVVGLNYLLLTGNCGEPPAWAKPKDGELRGYSRVFLNRAILDDKFWKYLRVMPVPANSGRELPKDAVGDARAPMHVVNMALNLTSGENLAWQQRMAESFTATPLHAGSARIGYRDAREYGGPKGISLGTAVSISGAAASPNMGYHSSPVMAFLLTFFNIRLGGWLGNPRNDKSSAKAHPTTNLIPFAKEATGSSNSESKWIYLSDGGHFENLGIYEMVMRRCRRIVVSDAGCDPKFTFEDLGNAIRKIRVDMGIPIEITDIDMNPRAADGKFPKGSYVAQARIRYCAVDPGAPDGELIYIKAGVYDDQAMPRDIYNYAMESMLFPHEPTSDQFFSESQFESYRALGRHAVTELITETDAAKLMVGRPKDAMKDFFDRAQRNANRQRQVSPQ